MNIETNINEKINKLAAELGFIQARPNIVQPATAYFDLLGDGLRRQLISAQNALGNGGTQSYVLRPEFTICIAQDYIHSLKNGQTKPARFCYSGPVFRLNGQHEYSEQVQTGIEIFAAKDSFQADIETIEYSLKALNNLGLKQVDMQMGDYGMFFALLKNLDISDTWRNKLKRLFLAHDKLENLLNQFSNIKLAPANAERAAFLKTMENLDGDAAQMLVENVLSISNIDLIGGRTAGEIAERFLAQAALAATPDLPDDVLQIIKQYLAISGHGKLAISQLEAFDQKYKVNLQPDIAALAKRFAAIDELKINGFSQDNITFRTLFGRGFEYYTGMVFEITEASKADAKPLIGGGRYDILAKQLGAKQPINAVGASLWNARIANLLQGDANV
ncbi:MAG: ATP phosphoribosyltransferase regulatory subunit [Rhizobiales bacterium]|nr:ATP phosphoribosyltransferase regulatory subunit [Hyphomicrobiales bacterium]NRB14261.1 ATP phosphoribosyltransferase regulatory subunit [Hyphomicrobiales bacterium]